MIAMTKIDSFRGDMYFLSNFYPCSVEYCGITYGSSEAAFQAAKCATNEERRQFAGLSATEAKKLGRRIPLRKDWEVVKVSIMREIVRCKFEQHPELQEKLLITNDAYLEEGNTWEDRTWGTVNGNGANLLGQILMEYRQSLLNSR